MAFKRKDLMVNLLPQVPPGDAGRGYGGGGGDVGGQGGGGCTCLTLPATMCVCLTYPATIEPCGLTRGCFPPTVRIECALASSIVQCAPDSCTTPSVAVPGTVYGADPEQLAALKDQLQKQIDLVEKAQKAQAERKKK